MSNDEKLQNSLTLQGAVDNGHCFRIPLYQRPFAWEEDQVRQLLNDLSESRKNHQDAPYYIGIISVATALDAPGVWDVIDGQQRLTTLILLAKAFGESKVPQLTLFGRPEDQALLDGNACQEGHYPNKKMKQVADTAEAFLKDNSIDKREARKLIRLAHFFIAPVPDGYSVAEKNQQFVRMNNRGKQLEKHEILKVRLISKLKEKSDEERVTKIWNRMQEILSGQPVEKEELKSLEDILRATTVDKSDRQDEPLQWAILDIPEFLLIALYRFLQNHSEASLMKLFSFNPDKLIQTFENCLLNPQVVSLNDIQRFFEILDQQSTDLAERFIFRVKDGSYQLGCLKDVGTEGMGPFKDSDDSKRKHLIILQSYLYQSTPTHLWMTMAFKTPQAPTRNDIEAFIEELETIDERLNTNEYPDLKRQVSPIDDLNSMTYGSISRYWFFRLDYLLWKKWHLEKDKEPEVWKLPEGVKKLIDQFRFRPCGSMEHIIPRNPIDDAIKLEGDELNRFGNLAAISASRNSRFSNLGPNGKREIIGAIEHGREPYTESLKMLHFLYCSDNPNYSDWIATHGQAMYEILRQGIKSEP